MSNGNNVSDQMLEMFLFEMSSLLEQLDRILLDSEQNKSLTQDDVNETFRIMHTIKGSAAMMEFNVISTVTHKLEDTFFHIRDNGIDDVHFTELFDLMLDATDFLKEQLDAIQQGTELATDNDQLTGRAVIFLEKLRGNDPAEAESAPTPAETVSEQAEPQPVADEPAPVDSMMDGVFTYNIDVLFEEDAGMENLRALMLLNGLQKEYTVISYDPADIESNPKTASDILVNGFTIVLESDQEPHELQDKIEQQMHVKSATVTPVEAAPSTAQKDFSGDVYDVDVKFDPGCGMENLRAFMLINTLRQSCKITSFDPKDIETNPDTAAAIINGGFKVSLETPLSKEKLQAIFDNAMHVNSAVLTQKSSAPKKEAAPATKPVPAPPAATAPTTAPAAAPQTKKAPPRAAKPVKQNLISVSLSKLDDLMNLMGELVITESMVIHSPDLRGVQNLDNFNKSVRQLLKLTDELQDMVMSVRMIPVASTFQRMHRIVRDMSRSLGKEAALVTLGEDTDIDKTIIDGIGDPIMHLVRNSMDHGVELPEDRIAAGKTPNATVTLSAQNTGGEILITVSDDGKGLDAEALLNKAQGNGILTKPMSEYTEKEAYMLLCAPGFSTKTAVTEYSGRGVGMDVVKKNIEKIGGTVVIESKKGHGMSVFLKIPLTLAIVDGMDIQVGDNIYTLQITSINESFKATKDQLIKDTTGNEMILLRGEVYPVIRLHNLFNVPNALTDIEEGIFIWVQSGDHSACLFVDQLIGEQQIVVKPLPLFLNRYDLKSLGISGCTILGDGTISLILDVNSIIEKTMEQR